MKQVLTPEACERTPRGGDEMILHPIDGRVLALGELFADCLNIITVPLRITRTIDSTAEALRDRAKH